MRRNASLKKADFGWRHPKKKRRQTEEDLAVESTTRHPRTKGMTTMPNALANLAAAQAAGYSSIVHDRGAGRSPRYFVTVEKHLTGATGASGGLARAYGEGDSQAAAEAKALAALNAQRNHRYGIAGGSSDSRGGALTADVT